MNDHLLPPRDYTLTIKGTDLDLDEVTLLESIDELFSLDLLVATTDHQLDLAHLAGERLTLSMPSPGGTLTVVALIASVAEESTEETGVSHYRIHAVPPVGLTRLRRSCRIFQDLLPTVIAATIFAEYKGRLGLPESMLAHEHRPREHLTQYGESDWEFVRRMLADEGICTFTRHDGSATMVMADDTSTFTKLPDAIPFVPPSQLRPEGFHVWHARVETGIATWYVTRREYYNENPAHKTDTVAVASNAPATPFMPWRAVEEPLEDYRFELWDDDINDYGRNRARNILEAARARCRATFSCNFHLPPGAVFTLSGHPRSDFNIDWLVVGAQTNARGMNASHRLDCVPLKQRHLPPQVPKPRILGTQTAFVVGDGEIDLDVYGRVCVKFHWDRREQATATTRRVRVSQGWAGGGYGLVCFPRVGDEVVVDFLDGDPDRPLVVGRVHNGAARGPQALPDQKTCSTWRTRSTPGGAGFNELRLDDAAGAELVYVHAQRDAHVDVLHDARVRIDGNVDSHVKGNVSGGVVGSGALAVQGPASAKVGGNLSVHTDADLEVSATNVTISAADQIHENSTNHFISTGGFYCHPSSVAQFSTANFHVFGGDIKLKGDTIRLEAGGSSIELADGSIKIVSSGPVEVNGSVVKLNC
jgi:type VI secretion system secreted protein VgrG